MYVIIIITIIIIIITDQCSHVCFYLQHYAIHLWITVQLSQALFFSGLSKSIHVT